MTNGGRLGHELPYALIKRALGHQVGTWAIGQASVVQGGPFAKDGGNIESYLSFSASHSSSFPGQSQGGLGTRGDAAEAAWCLRVQFAHTH